MREKIILSVVKVLDNLGIKFTIDDIKDELSISKKTIYKYFESKEELAQASFNYIIDKAKQAQKKVIAEREDMLSKIILCLLEYMEIYKLQSDKIFNLYSLNLKLRADVEEKAEENWNEMIKIYHCAKENDNIKVIEDKYFTVIVKGIIDQICHEKDSVKIGYNCLFEVLKKC